MNLGDETGSAIGASTSGTSSSQQPVLLAPKVFKRVAKLGGKTRDVVSQANYLLDENGIPGLLALLCSEVPAAVEQAAWALMCLAPAHHTAIAAAGGLRQMLALALSQSPELRAHASAALEGMLEADSSGACAKALLDAGALATLLPQLKSADPKAALVVLAALHVASAEHPRVRARLANAAGFVASLAGLLDSKHGELAGIALKCLMGALDWPDGPVDEAVAAGCVQRLAALIVQNHSAPELVWMACSAINSIQQCAAGRDAVQAHVLPSLVAALQMAPPVADAAAQTLSGLLHHSGESRPRVARALVAAGVLPPAVRLLRLRRHDRQAVEAANGALLLLLAVLTADVALAPEVVAAGAVKKVVALMRNPVAVAFAALSVLAILLREAPEVRATVAKAGIVPELVALLASGYELQTIGEDAVSTLFSLTTPDDPFGVFEQAVAAGLERQAPLLRRFAIEQCYLPAEWLLERLDERWLFWLGDAQAAAAATAGVAALALHPAGSAEPSSEAAAASPPRCAACGRAEGEAGVAKLKSCSRCHAVRYCGAECQKAHWRAQKADCGAAAASQQQQHE